MADIKLIVDSSTVVDANNQISKIGTGMQGAARSATQSAGVFVSAFNSIEGAIKQVERANAQFEKSAQSNYNAILGVDKAFNSAKDSAKAFAAELDRQDVIQKYYANILKVDQAFESAEKSAAVFTAELAKQDAEVDRLAKKYNPLYAASKKYESALEELNRAQKLGAINSAQYRAALDRLDTDFAQFNSGVVRAGNQFGSFDKAAYKSAQGLKRFGSVGLQQVGYQVGDFAVQVQGGQNAIVALGQQGTQLLGIFGPAGAIAGAFFAVGTAIGNVAWQSYKASKDIKTLGDATKDLGAALGDLNRTSELLSKGFGDSLAPAFDSLTTKARDFLSAVQDIENNITLKAFKSAQQALTKDLSSFVGTYKTLVESFSGEGYDLEFVLPKAPYDLATQDAFKLNEILAKIGGTTAPEIEKSFQDAVSEISKLNLESDQFDSILSDVIKSLNLKTAAEEDSLRVAKEAKKAQDELFAVWIASSGGGRGSVNPTPYDWLDGFEHKLQQSKEEQDKLFAIWTEKGGGRGEVNPTPLDWLDDYVHKLEMAQEKQDKLIAIFANVGGGRGRVVPDELDRQFSAMGGIFGYDDGAPQKEKRVRKEKPYNLKSEKPFPIPERRPTDVAAESISKLIKDREKLLTLSQEELRLDEIRAEVVAALGDKQKFASEGQINAAVATIAATEEAIERQRELDGVASTIADSFGNAFMSIVEGTQSASDAFKTMAATILKELFKILVVEQLVKSIKTVVGAGFSAAGASNAGGVGLSASPSWDGSLASGGSALPGQTLLVGERGPEVINMGANRGTVVNADLTAKGQGDGSVVIHQSFNFQANGDESVKRIIQQAAPNIAQMAVSSIVNERSRGGRVKRTFG